MNIPWGKLRGNPYGSWLRADHPRRLVIYCDGEEFMAGGFIREKNGAGQISYQVDFAVQKSISAFDWFERTEPLIPSAWKKEHVSLFTGSSSFNIECLPVPLPQATEASIEYAEDHPVAQQFLRWSILNHLNVHYTSISALEMTLQWFHSRRGWKNMWDLRFFLGYDGTRWFVAGATQAGLCAFTAVDQPQETIDMISRGTKALGAETFPEFSIFAPGKDAEAITTAENLKALHFPLLHIETQPFGPLAVPCNHKIRPHPIATPFLQSLLPGERITHA